MLKLSRHRVCAPLHFFFFILGRRGENTSKERDESEELGGQHFEGLVDWAENCSVLWKSIKLDCLSGGITLQN